MVPLQDHNSRAEAERLIENHAEAIEKHRKEVEELEASLESEEAELEKITESLKGALFSTLVLLVTSLIRKAPLQIKPRSSMLRSRPSRKSSSLGTRRLIRNRPSLI